MKPKAKFIDTPVGRYDAPLNPCFIKKLKECKCNEDLFALVDVDGFIDPDAFNEVISRNIIDKYKTWKDKVKGSKWKSAGEIAKDLTHKRYKQIHLRYWMNDFEDITGIADRTTISGKAGLNKTLGRLMACGLNVMIMQYDNHITVYADNGNFKTKSREEKQC